MPNKFYHGFTCPMCGSHYFSTSTKPGINHGYCESRLYGGVACDFSWNRNDVTIEKEVFYEMSLEEIDRQISFSDGVSGAYGSMAYRSHHDYRLWECTDGDYKWNAVADDFGTLIRISSYTNVRGY